MHATGAQRAPSNLIRVVRVAAGNALEMYDFQVFGYYASAVAATFFPARSAYASLILSLMTFGAGFLIRPLGAIVLGAYIDRRGRRDGLLLTLALMGVGTLSIACLPGFAVIGVLAPLLVLLGRLLQGFSAGVELGGVSVYLSEIAPLARKGFYVAWQSASQQFAVIFAAAVGIALTSSLSATKMTAWGWRIAFLCGCALLPFLFYLRRSLEETPAFLSRPQRPSTPEILAILARHWRVVVLGMGMSVITTVSFYLATVYAPTYGTSVLHLSARSAYLATICVGVLNLIVLPSFGALSDRLGRRPILFACGLAALASAYPALAWVVAHPSFPRLLAVELWMGFLYSSYNGAMAPYLTEIMPAEIRTLGFALAYSLATAVFGGFTPAICTWLIHVTGNPAAPGLWLMFASICGLMAVLTLRGTCPIRKSTHSGL